MIIKVKFILLQCYTGAGVRRCGGTSSRVSGAGKKGPQFGDGEGAEGGKGGGLHSVYI